MRVVDRNGNSKTRFGGRMKRFFHGRESKAYRRTHEAFGQVIEVSDVQGMQKRRALPHCQADSLALRCGLIALTMSG
jgi:hypothetical protein